MSKYTKSARGQDCTVRVPGVCNHSSETTVFAHLNGGGMGMKRADIHGAYCCSACHSWLDGGYTQTQNHRSTRDLYHYQAMIETQEIMIKEGTLKL